VREANDRYAQSEKAEPQYVEFLGVARYLT
jgi:hypothetical protein